MTTNKDAVPSDDAIEQECPKCGALCLVDDGNYVALESLPVQAEEAPQDHAADVRNALVSLECVRQWLRGGCDPKAAAIEVAGIMRMLQGAPASEVQADRVPTVMDALKCVVDGTPFHCHQEFDDRGVPTDLCAGWAIASAAADQALRDPMKAQAERALTALTNGEVGRG